jgi:PhnB protein
MRVEPYLFFHGRCAEALEFYRTVLGATIEAVVRHGDVPGSAPEAKDKIMHAAMRIGDTAVLASDGRGSGGTTFSGFSIALQVADSTEAERLFGLLATGGAVQVPMMSTPFAACFGMVADRFGTPWMIVTERHPAR